MKKNLKITFRGVTRIIKSALLLLTSSILLSACAGPGDTSNPWGMTGFPGGNETPYPGGNGNPAGGITDITDLTIQLSIDTRELSTYGRVTLNWTSPDTTSTYYVWRGNAKIATCDKLYCWWFEVPYKYHYTDESVKENKSYTYTIRNDEGVILSNQVDVTVPYFSFEEPDDSIKLNEGLVCDKKFWGTWINMATGVEYTVYENYVTDSEGSKYAINTNSSETNLNVKLLSNFKIEDGSDGAILVDMNGVPYFRKGGVNLEYSLKLVGLSSRSLSGSRAVSTSNIKVKSKSKNYPSFESSSDNANAGDTVKLTAPTQGDTQTVTLQLSDDSLIVVPDITISNSGDNMGTIAISDGDQYTLKVTGTVKEADKTQGYLYSGNEYPLTLTLYNNSEYEIHSSSLKITPASSAISVSHKNGKNLSGIAIPKMMPESTDEEPLLITYNGNIDGYIDTGLVVQITNSETNEVWEDYVPLRFFGGLIPLTFACESVKDNNSALNGFVIYPDGNSKFFAVRSGGKKTLYVPKFKDSDKYTLAFSGATTAKYLSDATEVFYSVDLGSQTATVIPTSGEEVLTFQQYGGSNHKMNQAYPTDKDSFIAYLSSGEADYYTFSPDGLTVLASDKITFDTNYHLTYENPKANTLILKWELESGTPMSEVAVYINGNWVEQISTSSKEFKYEMLVPGAKYTVTFVDPDDPLVSASNTLGFTSNYLKYPRADISGYYDAADKGVIFYFNQFSYREEFMTITVYRNNTVYKHLSDFEALFSDRDSVAVYQVHGFYMIFDPTGSQALNYTPKDKCFGFIDMQTEAGQTYTYCLRDSTGHRLSDDLVIKY